MLPNNTSKLNGLIVQTKNLYKSYHVDGVDTPVLHGISVEVKRGEFVAVMGPSGCGKSTLLHILGLMLSAESADCVILDGIDTLNLNQSQKTQIRREKIGFVFQRFNLLEVLSVEDNLNLAMTIRGFEPSEQKLRDLLERVGLSDKRRHKPHQMSIGQQQRLAIARAVIHQPAILLADEPTGNLDSDNAENILSLLKSLNKETNQTIIMVTHNTELSDQVHRVVHMKDGRIVR
jgi:putative ABC transport system ATP-binding protein